jgi:hypothetical protein
VHPSGKHYSLDFRRFRKKEDCVARGEPFQNHTDLCLELIDWVVAEGIPGEFSFDSYFTNAAILNHIHAVSRTYVGDLKANRIVTVDSRDIQVSDWIATHLLLACRTKITVAGVTQWYFTKTVRIPKLDHYVRIVVLWPEERAKSARKILITNRTYWEVHRVLKTYRKRWSGTETFHRDGTQHLGMGDCQPRSGEGQTRHMHLVLLAYTALMRQLKHDRALDWAHMCLTTIGESCRLIARETLAKTLAWADGRDVYIAQIHARGLSYRLRCGICIRRGLRDGEGQLIAVSPPQQLHLADVGGVEARGQRQHEVGLPAPVREGDVSVRHADSLSVPDGHLERTWAWWG